MSEAVKRPRKNQVKKFKSIEDDIERQRKACDLTIASAVEPIRSLPELLTDLDKKGRKEDSEKLLALGKTIASDVECYMAEKRQLDQQFEVIKQATRTERVNIGQHHMTHLDIGSKYLTLNQRILSTASQAASDFIEIASADEAVEETVNE